MMHYVSFIDTNALVRAWGRFAFTDAERARLYRKLGDQIREGISVRNAIDNMHKRIPLKADKPKKERFYFAVRKLMNELNPLAIVLRDVALFPQRGEELSDALRRWGKPSEIMVISAGEKSSRLSESLLLVSEMIEGISEMKESVKSALAEPGFYLIATIAAIWYMGNEVIPQMTGTLGDPDKLQGDAHALYQTSQFVQSPWFFFSLILAVAGMAVITWLMPKAFGKDRFRVHLEAIPPWSLYKMITGTSFLVALSALHRAGMAVRPALITMSDNATPYLRVRIEQILFNIKKGDMNIALAMDECGYNFPDKDIIDDLVIYSSLNNFDEIMHRYGKKSMLEGVKRIKTLATVLKYLAYFVVFKMVIFLSDGFIDLQNQIQKMMQLD